ncbi:hypothetical protein HK105_203058 [Polyrhizophydium stewartii]|uniref:Uncharacterized protein n=1 Tax=Polyrhizophydium stewartii TaxID=2732419 RepID=A0ABR4NCW4_9FUNG
MSNTEPPLGEPGGVGPKATPQPPGPSIAHERGLKEPSVSIGSISGIRTRTASSTIWQSAAAGPIVPLSLAAVAPGRPLSYGAGASFRSARSLTGQSLGKPRTAPTALAAQSEAALFTATSVLKPAFEEIEPQDAPAYGSAAALDAHPARDTIAVPSARAANGHFRSVSFNASLPSHHGLPAIQPIAKPTSPALRSMIQPGDAVAPGTTHAAAPSLQAAPAASSAAPTAAADSFSVVQAEPAQTPHAATGSRPGSVGVGLKTFEPSWPEPDDDGWERSYLYYMGKDALSQSANRRTGGRLAKTTSNPVLMRITSPTHSEELLGGNPLGSRTSTALSSRGKPPSASDVPSSGPCIQISGGTQPAGPVPPPPRSGSMVDALAGQIRRALADAAAASASASDEPTLSFVLRAAPVMVPQPSPMALTAPAPSPIAGSLPGTAQSNGRGTRVPQSSPAGRSGGQDKSLSESQGKGFLSVRGSSDPNSARPGGTESAMDMPVIEMVGPPYDQRNKSKTMAPTPTPMPSKPVWRGGGNRSQTPVFFESDPNNSDRYAKHTQWVDPKAAADANARVFTRYEIILSHREKARQVALKARSLINATVQRRKAAEASSKKSTDTIENDMAMFERIQKRMHDRAATPVDMQVVRSHLNLVDDDVADTTQFAPGSTRAKQLAGKVFGVPERDKTAKEPTSSVLMYTPDSVRQRKAKRMRRRQQSVDSGLPGGSSPALDQTPRSSAEARHEHAPQHAQHHHSPHAHHRSKDALHGSGERIHAANAGMRRAQSESLMSRVQVPKEVLVPRHADVVKQQMRNKANDGDGDGKAGGYTGQDTVEEQFEFFHDFEVLLGRETSVQADAIDSVAPSDDVVPASLRAAISNEDQLAMAWHAFVHLRCMAEPIVCEEDVEAIYQIMSTPGATAEQQTIGLRMVVVGMERKHYVYLKAFTGHLRRLARAGRTKTTKAISCMFATVIFRARCPETGDVYVSPQLRTLVQIRDDPGVSPVVPGGADGAGDAESAVSMSASQSRRDLASIGLRGSRPSLLPDVVSSPDRGATSATSALADRHMASSRTALRGAAVVHDAAPSALPFVQAQAQALEAPAGGGALTVEIPRATLSRMFVDDDAAGEFAWAEASIDSAERALFAEHSAQTPFAAALELLLRFWNAVFDVQDDAVRGTH